MPWNIAQKKFIRTNSIEFSGSDVWYQDQQASIKIIATRHDFHDQDMADGISRCLNIDGINQMASNIDMQNTYKVINLIPGTNPNDSARFGQLIDTMSFNNTNRVLTLTAPDGLILTATIPDETGGGGGSGTVTQIDVGAGLVANPDPITITGEISLEPLSAISAANGIGAITVDTYGRVVSVTGNFGAGYVSEAPTDGQKYVRQNSSWVLESTGGGSGPVDLTVTRSSTTNTISAGGDPAVLNLADGSNAGLLSPSEKSKISSLPTSGSAKYDSLWWDNSPAGWKATNTLQINPEDPETGITVNGAGYFTGNVTVGGQLGVDQNAYCHGDMEVQGTQPEYKFYETDATTNEKRWSMWASSGLLRIGAFSDSDVWDTTAYFEINRTGSDITEFDFIGAPLRNYGNTVRTSAHLELGGSTSDTLRWDGSKWVATGILACDDVKNVAVYGELFVDAANGGTGSLTFDGDTVYNKYAGGGTTPADLDNSGRIVRGVAAASKTGVEALIDELVAQGALTAGAGTTLKTSL